MSAKRYTCDGYALGEGWVTIKITIKSDTGEIIVKEVRLPEKPFLPGSFRGCVIREVATKVTDELYGPVLTGEALAIPEYRTKIVEMARIIDKDPSRMLGAIDRLIGLAESLRDEVSEDGNTAFCCWRSIVMQMNAFDSGVPCDDSIHRDPTPEEMAAKDAAHEAKMQATREARSAAAKKGHAKKTKVAQIIEKVKSKTTA